MTPIATQSAALPVAGQTQLCTIITSSGWAPSPDRAELPGQSCGVTYRAVHECRASRTWTGPARCSGFDAQRDAIAHEADHYGRRATS